MKKTFFTIATLLVANLSIAQWKNKSVDNGFDNPYRICYTHANNGAVLKLEKTSGGIAFYLQGGYFCDEVPYVELSFLVNNKWVKYSLAGFINDERDSIFLTDYLQDSEFFMSFLNCNSVRLRVNDEYPCVTEIYEFNMSGSTSAFNFIK
jgi:hypothetical protein